MHRDGVELFDPILRFMTEARKVTQRARLRKIGARRSTGAAMSPGRRAGLGGTRAAAHETRVQHMLPLHGKRNRRAGFEPGSFPAHLSHARELPAGLWGVSHVAHERDAQFAGGSLPAHAPRPRDGLDRRCDAGARRKALSGANARPARRSVRVERAIAARTRPAFARVARGGDLARFAGLGIQRDSSGTRSARRHRKIKNQSRAHRAGAGSGRDGRTTVVIRPERVVGRGFNRDVSVWSN